MGEIPLSLLTSAGGEGAEVIYALRNNDKLSSKILNGLSESGQIIRKYYQRRLPSDTSKDYYYMIRNTPNAETVIVEYGFLDNKNDADRIKQNYKKYVDAVVDAVLDYKGISVNNDGYYIVKKGDSLWSIANNNGITVSDLKKLNNLTSNNLSIGQKLKLENNNDNNGSNDNLYSSTYVVKNGDTLYSIAKKYNVSVDDIKSVNNLTNNNLTIGQVIKIPGINIEEPNTYTVKKGDSLWSIANKYGTSVEELKKVNNLTSNVLSSGQLLKLPGTSKENTVNTYTVKRGDTLYSIASKYNISVDKLKKINNLTSNNLSIGQTLNLIDKTDNITSEDYDYYTVKNGDTLYSIANKFDTTVSKIKELNNLPNNMLSVGQMIKIPGNLSSTYVVKSGDTLWSIAKDNNISVDKLKEINNLTSNNLTIGQQLLIN